MLLHIFKLDFRLSYDNNLWSICLLIWLLEKIEIGPLYSKKNYVFPNVTMGIKIWKVIRNAVRSGRKARRNFIMFCNPYKSKV